MFNRIWPREGNIITPDNEFRKTAYPFLETQTPTDSLPNPLGNASVSLSEKRVLIQKRRWFDTLWPEKLTSLVARIIEDRQQNPITTAVVLGISGSLYGFNNGDDSDRDCGKFVAFSQILAQLGRAHPRLLRNIYIQDPVMTAEWKTLCENHGMIVVEHLTALEHLGPNTVLFAPWLQQGAMARILDGRAISELAMFFGNGCALKDGSAERVAEMDEELKENPHAHDNLVSDACATHKMMEIMLDRDVCNHEDLPCDRPNGKDYKATGPWRGLQGLDIWWRPARTEHQKAQDKVIRKFMRACKIEYGGDFVEFMRAYHAGLDKLDEFPEMQDRIVYSVIAAAHFERAGKRPMFQQHVIEYQRGLTEAQLKYENFIDLLLDRKGTPTTDRWNNFWLFIGGRVDSEGQWY